MLEGMVLSVYLFVCLFLRKLFNDSPACVLYARL